MQTNQRTKEETDNEDENEMVKVPVEGDLAGKKTISFNSNKFQKKDSVVDKIQVTIDGVAQNNKTGDNIIAAVRAGDMESSNDIVVVAISNAFKIPNSAVLEGVYVSLNNKKQSEVAALRVLDNGEVN